MRNAITDLKEKMEEGSVESYYWLSTRGMVADCLTKELRDIEELQEIVKENLFIHSDSSHNLVSYKNGEIGVKNKTS